VASHATSKIGSFDDHRTRGQHGFSWRSTGVGIVGGTFFVDVEVPGRRRGMAHRSRRRSPPGARPAQHPPGTTIEVRDLFYNVPARRKFLRAERTEFAHIDDLLKSLALAREGVDIRLTHNGKPCGC